MSDISVDVRREGWMKTLDELNPRETEIVSLLRLYPDGMTSWDVHYLTKHLVHAIRPRFTRLEEFKIVEAVGKRFHAPTKRNETVWRLSGGRPAPSGPSLAPASPREALAVSRPAPSGPVSGPASPGVGVLL